MDFGLYLHVPFCRVHCPYCDFVVAAGASWPEERYVSALVAELGRRSGEEPWSGGRVATIYLGGGTPSLFAPESIGRILEAVRARFPVAAGAEVTLEANPENAAVERLSEFRARGVNRLSIGIQSFSPRLLKVLGRLGTAADTLRAVPAARRAGFEDVSLDLIFAVPGQTLDEWRDDLDQAIELAPDHVSAYGLTYEEATPFFALRRDGRLRAVDDDAEAEMFDEARERLPAAGYAAYEVSSFARPGHEARHNAAYWRAVPYLGVGAGAHSYVPEGPRGRRLANERDVAAYVKRALAGGDAVAAEESLDEAQSAREALLLGLRRTAGFSERSFGARFGRPPEEVFPRIPELVEGGLLERAGGRLRLTARGLRVADSVLEAL